MNRVQTDNLALLFNEEKFDPLLYLAIADSFEEEGENTMIEAAIFRLFYARQKWPAELKTAGGIFIGHCWFCGDKGSHEVLLPVVFSCMKEQKEVGQGGFSMEYGRSVIFPTRAGAIFSLAVGIKKVWASTLPYLPPSWRKQ